MRRLLYALALVVTFATGVYADKVVNRTYFTAVLADVHKLCFVRDAATPQGWRTEASAGIRANDGNGYSVTVTGNTTAGQKTTVEGFITTHALPVVNTQEGL